MPYRQRRSYKELTLAQLRSFSVVCRAGSYAAAARELMLTSPAVWEQMHGLERHYGCRLLKRHGNGVAPTPEGEQLLEMIRPPLAGIDSARDALRQQGGALPATLTVATNLRVLAEEVCRGLRRFQQSYPAIQMHLVFTGNDVDQRVARGEADIGFTLEPGPDNSCMAAVQYEPAGEVDYLLVVPRRHPLLRARALQLRQIARHPLVLGEAAAYSRRRVQEVLHRNNLTEAVKIAVETSSDEYTLACVRAGLGLGIMVGSGRGPLYGGLGVRSLSRRFGTARLGFVWRRGAHLPDVHRQLARAIKNCLKVAS
jgi:DNA-binding transcriptional LysR family regulator